MSKNKRKNKSASNKKDTKADKKGSNEPAEKKGEDPKKAAENRDPNTFYDTIRENFEAVIVAFILALIIRHFAVEAFEIPTGSMAPTLYGIHAWNECPNCETDFNFGLPSDSSTGQLTLRYGKLWVYRGTDPFNKTPHTEAQPFAPQRRYVNQPQLENWVPGKVTFQSRSGIEGQTWVGDAKDFQQETVVTQILGSGYTDYNANFILRCPTCQYIFNDVLTEASQTGGHKILVNKLSYRFSQPKRFDVIVFQKDERQNYIKRLLGLPGESVQLKGGDLYVKNRQDDPKDLAGSDASSNDGFKIIRKSDYPIAQSSLWIKIADTSIAEKGYNPVPMWREVYEKGSDLDQNVKSKWWQWLPREKRWSVNNLGAAKPDPEKLDRVAILRFNRKSDNYYNYNGRMHQGQAAFFNNGSGSVEIPDRGDLESTIVGDKKVSFKVEPSQNPSGAGWVGAELRDGDHVYQLRFALGKKRANAKTVLFRVPVDVDRDYPSPNRPVPESLKDQRVESDFTLALGKRSAVSFENLDDRLAVTVDGTEILALEFSSGSKNLRSSEQTDLLLLASNATATFEDVKVYRDIYYAPYGMRHGSSSKLRNQDDTYTIPAHVPDGVTPVDPAIKSELNLDEYFPCGDNNPSSADGRDWGSVPQSNMMGKAFFIFWPAWPTNWQMGFIQ